MTVWRVLRRWALPLVLALGVGAVALGHVAPGGGSGAPAAVAEAGLDRAGAVAARRTITADVPEAQRAALADGRVTDAEYRAAVARSMTCLEEAVHRARPGPPPVTISFEGPTRSTDGFSYGFGFRLDDPELDPRPLDRRCQARELDRVEALFHLQRREDPAYMARVTRRFHRCLDRAGLPGAEVTGPRARFLAVLADDAVGDEGAVAARRCIGDLPSIGDQDL